ncbi:MAG: hypothetical protein RBS89_08255 [Candidatus Delongbacteria bacterium]|nr:hypothetical protein [Candidatus Delongbacteria bacterium]
MKYFLLFLIFTASCLNAFSLMGEQNDDRFIWVGGGLVTMDTDDASLVGINAFINYSKNDRIFKLRGINAAEMILFGPKPNDEVWELGLLYGLRSINGKVSVSFLAGLSYTGGIYKGDRLDNDYYEELTFETVGLPLEVQCDAKLSDYFGFSITFYADINTEKIYGGVNLAILIGYLP